MKSEKKYFGYPILFVFVLLFLMGCRKENVPQTEMGAVWIQPGLFSTTETKAGQQIDSLFDNYKEIGVNNLFCYNAAPGENSFQWDYLKTLIAKGHQRGINIHPTDLQRV